MSKHLLMGKSPSHPFPHQAVEAQIRSFGQTPCQVLIEPHPPRSSAMQVGRGGGLVLGRRPSQTPRQHLSRGRNNRREVLGLWPETEVGDGEATPLMFTEQMQQDVIMVLKFPSNSPVAHVAANTQPGLSAPAVITVTANRLFAVNKWHGLTGHQGSSTQDQQYQLPVEIDPLIASNVGTHRRQITDLLDQSIQVHPQCFVITADNRFVLVCGFWDKSFRVYSTDTGKLTQIVFGHRDVVTCLSRSESYIGGDCYILSGSRDATLLLWYWNGKNCSIGENMSCASCQSSLSCPLHSPPPPKLRQVGGGKSAQCTRVVAADSSAHPFRPSLGQTGAEFVTPRAILTGHDCEITCASVCAELGLVVSGCKEGPCLIHSMNGDLLRTLEAPVGCLQPRLIQASTEGHCVIYYDRGQFCVFSINGKELGHMEVDESIRGQDPTDACRRKGIHQGFTTGTYVSESTAGEEASNAALSQNTAGLQNTQGSLKEALLFHAMLLSRDGQYLLTGGDGGVLTVWRVHDLKQLFTYPGCDAGIRSMAMSHDQRCIITGMASGSIVLFYNDFNRWHHEYQTRY
ncbi:hypothetical protein Z043_100011 [Scleropages formosus]|uniref:BEACH domain-containing protein n=1 Tax=Scleropages formosus TaxID=113540 RepID=A0A0P7VCZ6_SCLFO|nr:hypothetical protein Z043_100011 [Scleropages formosus]